MASVLSVIAAITAITLMSRFSTSSATALGKVSAMVSVTATLAEAWSKAQGIARQLSDHGTVPLPSTRAATVSSAVVPTKSRSELDEFFDENPGLTARTGGLRGYSAYAPFDR